MPYRPHLKICGVTNPEDARLLGRAGVDYCGILVDVAFSERSLTLEQAKRVAGESKIPVVILMCDPKTEAVLDVVQAVQPHAVQLLCRESPEFITTLKQRTACQIWKTIHLPTVIGQSAFEAYIDAGADALLVDSIETGEGFERFGGTGKVADWKAAAAMIRKTPIPIFLAGGIGPHNVEKALFEVRPFGIDLCSGVEAVKGKKDPEKLSALIKNFKAAAMAVQRKET